MRETFRSLIHLTVSRAADRSRLDPSAWSRADLGPLNCFHEVDIAEGEGEETAAAAAPPRFYLEATCERGSQPRCSDGIPFVLSGGATCRSNMWRISNGGFSHSAHPEPDWALLRVQLSTARIARDTGSVPPLALLVDEIAGMARFHRQTGHLPFGGYAATADYLSLTADLDASLGQIGPRLRGIATTALTGSYDARWQPPSRGAHPPWTTLFEAGDALMSRLRDPEALVAALDDAFEATRRDRLEDALVALAPQLDELRALSELQRAPWRRTQSLVEAHLTVRGKDEESLGFGRHPAGTEPAEILAALKDALRKPVTEREWAVWTSTLAGPSPEHETPSAAIVSGPFAVSGRPCTGDIHPWLERIRDELSVAFTSAGRPVPADVLALGEPQIIDGTAVFTGEQLWSHVASPASFVARVAVCATSSEEAIHEAQEALIAVYGFSEPGLPGDVRPDAVVWTEAGGWAKPSSTARDLAMGAVHATRHATRAVRAWAQDLGSPLDSEELDLLRSRSLVQMSSASTEVRLMRAFASLEALTPAGSKLDHVAGRLWVRTLQTEAYELLGHLLSRVRDPAFPDPPCEGALWDDRKARAADLYEMSLRWNSGLLDAIDHVLEVIHPDALTPALSRATRILLKQPGALAEAKERHAAAWKRARRHRNLTTHGHRVSDRTLAPTVSFLADQLECAIAAKADDTPAAAWLGSLASGPNLDGTANLADLLDR